MLTGYVHVLTLLLWIAVVGVIVAGAVHGIADRAARRFKGSLRCPADGGCGGSFRTGPDNRDCSPVDYRTAIWSSIGMFTAALGLRTFVKYAEKRVQ